MALPQESYECWSFQTSLAAADASKTLLAAPSGTNRRRVVLTYLRSRIKTSAAQSVAVASGATVLMNHAASEAVGVEQVLGPLIKGIVCPDLTAIIATPAAAGPAIDYWAEGYYQ